MVPRHAAHLRLALVMAGVSIEKLKEMLGHSTVLITERYAHLRVDLFAEHDLGTLSLDLRPGSSQTDAVGQSSGSGGA